VLCNPAATGVILTLPAATPANSGVTMTIKRLNTSANTCGVNGLNTIDSAATLALAAPVSGGASRNSITVISTGTTWYMLSAR
jgi:hypothetical protein